MIKYSLAFLTIAIDVASCGIINLRQVKGNGNIQSESRSQKDFNRVETNGSFDVLVTTDSVYSVKIEADQNLLQYIETSLDGNNLKIRTASGFSLDPSSAIKVYLSAPSYSNLRSSGSGNIVGKNRLVSNDDLSLDISGSGDINVDVHASSVTANISGSGKITVAGDAKSLKTSIAGNGDILASKLKTEETSVNIAGNGDIHVNASKQLNIHILGSGSVKYIGNPVISQQVAGSGSVGKEQ